MRLKSAMAVQSEGDWAGFSEQLLHESLGPSCGSSWEPGARYLVLICRSAGCDSEVPCCIPFTQRGLSTNSMPGTILDAENRENQTQDLPPWRRQSIEHVVAQSLHQQAWAATLPLLLSFPPSTGLPPEPRVPSLTECCCEVTTHGCAWDIW